MSRHFRGWSTRPGRVSEDMQISQRKALDHASGFFKLIVSLAGKTHHHIGADCGRRHGRANLFNLLAIVPWTILAMHAPENRVTARLHWNVGMLRNACRVGD